MDFFLIFSDVGRLFRFEIKVREYGDIDSVGLLNIVNAASLGSMDLVWKSYFFVGFNTDKKLGVSSNLSVLHLTKIK